MAPRTAGLNSLGIVPFTRPAMAHRTSALVSSLLAFGAGTVVTLAAAGCGSTTTRQGFTDPGDPAAPGGTGTDPSDPGSTGSSGTPAPMPTKPGCAQTMYTETLPTSASLSSLSFSSTQAQAYMLGALQLRYPLGKFITEGGISSPLAAQQGNCVDRFLSDKSSADAVLRGATTAVHECGHLFDLGQAKGASGATYVLRTDLRFDCSDGDTTTRNGKTFARSLIRGDGYYAKRPACPANQASAGCDFYADTYLDGSATDAMFDSGDQGYNSVLEEATQYINSLATALAFKDAFAGSKSSDRDGILTFLWYIERYHLMARTKYPSAYTLLSGDACWRQATLSVWDRAWFYLDATKGMDELGLDDAALEMLVKDAALTGEIDALRKLECQ